MSRDRLLTRSALAASGALGFLGPFYVQDSCVDGLSKRRWHVGAINLVTTGDVTARAALRKNDAVTWGCLRPSIGTFEPGGRMIPAQVP